MVESYVKIRRKDYLKVCELLELINSDLKYYKNKDNEEIIEATKRKIADAKIILSEE